MDDSSPSAQRMAPPLPTGGFQTASSLYKNTASTTSNSSAGSSSGSGSYRNASGGLPPIPKESPAPNLDSASTTATSAAVSTKPINRPAASKKSIIYSAVQRRNPVLGAIRNVNIEIGDIVADYQVGTHNGVLFLSLKYHRLHPEYIHQRIEKMKNSYSLRILLVLCDVNEHQQSLRELSKIAIINQFSLFLAWSNEEVAQYLSTFKSFENKSADSLKERIHQSYHDQLQHVLTSGRKVNKTDADNLAAQFGSFATMSNQPAKILSSVKGLGATKVTSLIDAFNKPFLVGGLRREEKEIGDPLVVSQKEQNAVGAPVTPRTIGKEKGKEQGKDKEGNTEREVSPDWPSDDDDEGDVGVEEGQTISRGRKQNGAGSRSPGLSPELGIETELAIGEPSAEIWQDPLDDDDDDDDGDEDGDEPTTKRVRREM